MKLDQFDNSSFIRGRPILVEVLWRIFEGLFFNSWIPGTSWRCAALRAFGSRIGKGVVIKPYVRVKFPWKLSIGDHSWIGESVWIDNLGEVAIGSSCCISQGAYLCTGSHRWDKETFDLEVKPIGIGEQCWIGAMCRIGPGVVIGSRAVLTYGSVLTSDIGEGQVFSGMPAVLAKVRTQA